MKINRANILLVIPMYLFLLFCVGTFGWLLLTANVRLTSGGLAVLLVQATAFLVALHSTLGARLIYQRRGLSGDFRAFVRGRAPLNSAARLPWALARLGVFCWLLVATAMAVTAAGLASGYFAR